MARQRHTLAGTLAILFAIVTFSALFIPSHPEWGRDPTPEQIRGVFEAEGTLQAAQVYVHAIGATLFLAFVAALTPALRRAEGGGGALGLAFLGSGMAIGAFLVLSAALASAAGSFHEFMDIDPRIFLAVYVIAWQSMFGVIFLTPVFLGAFGLLALRKRAAPASLGYASLLLAGFHLVAGVGVVLSSLRFLMYVGYGLFLLWGVLVGLVLLVGMRADAPADAAGASPA